ncbi:MAG: glycosyltransferase [Kiritimatiellia bacterium]
MKNPATKSTDPVRIRVMILSDAIPNRNGVGTYYHDLMDYLRDELEHVEMIPARANCIFKKSRMYLPLPSDRSQHLYLPNVLRIFEQVRKERPDILVAPTLGPFALLARIVARRKKLPLVFGYHTSLNKLVGLYWRGPLGRFSSWYLKRASRVMFRHADAVVVNTDHMAAEAGALGASRVHIMGTTIARLFIENPVTPYEGRMESVLFAGRLAKEKKVMAIVEAAAALPDLRFVFAGEGPLREELEQSSKGLKNVEFTGWLSREALLERVDEADVVVLPSEHESFGSIALEAMARERLMLVSENCGILRWPDLARGLCVIREGESVTDALSRLQAASVEERIRIARTARDATHDMNRKTTEEWMNLFNSLHPRG